MIGRFLTQPNGAYRNFQLVFTVLTLNFVIPSISYLVAPEAALKSVHQLSDLFGVPYTACEDGHFWRFLAFSDVATLGFICLLLQLNIRRWYPALLPLMFLKSCSVFASAYVGLFQYQHPFFICPVVLDSVTVAAMGFFASRAHRQIRGRPDGELVPRPRFVEPEVAR